MTESAFEWDAINVSGLVITVFNYVVFIPLIIYGLLLFHQHKENEIITYRNPLAVTLMSVIVIFGLMFERMYILLTNIFGIVVVPAWSLHFLFALTWDGLMYLKIANIYYIYFRQQYNLAIADMAWKQNIDSEIPASYAWYIDHNDTFGNMTYLTKMIIFPYIFMGFVDAIIAPMVDNTPDIYGDSWEIEVIHSLEVLVPVISGFVILYKLRLVNDIYEIRNEVFITMLMMSCSFMVYMVVFSMHYLDESKLQSSVWHRTSSLINIFIMDMVAFPCSILSTLYPVYLIKKRKMERNSQQQLMTYSQLQNRACSDLQTMDKIMSDYTSYAAFMSHLVSEFCPENLLFLTELIECKILHQKRKKNLVQIFANKENGEKQIILVNFNKNPMDLDVTFRSEEGRNFTYIFHSGGSIMTKLSLSPKVPTPVMIKKYPHSLYCQMATLYAKYVKVGSQFQLNISGLARTKLSKIFEDEYREKSLFNGRPRLIPIPLDELYADGMLYTIMDEVVIEILQLLQYSFSRFVLTEAFQCVNEGNKFMDNNYALFADNDIVTDSNIEMIECPAQTTDELFAKRLNDPESGILIIKKV